MPRCLRLCMAAGALALIGPLAGQAMADDAVLAKYPGAKEQIVGYYQANAREGAGNCGAGNITAIGDAKVVADSGDSVVVAVNYTFSATPTATNTVTCSGEGALLAASGKVGMPAKRRRELQLMEQAATQRRRSRVIPSHTGRLRIRPQPIPRNGRSPRSTRPLFR